MEAPGVRNRRPFVKAFGVAFALIALLFVALQLRGASATAFAAAGELSFSILVGATVCGIWAKRATGRWSVFGFGWRYLLCLVIAFVVTSFLTVAGRQ